MPLLGPTKNGLRRCRHYCVRNCAGLQEIIKSVPERMVHMSGFNLLTTSPGVLRAQSTKYDAGGTVCNFGMYTKPQEQAHAWTSNSSKG